MRTSNFSSRERSIPNREIYERERGSSGDVSYYKNRLGPLSNLLLTDDPTNVDALQKRIRTYASFLLAISVFFWSWAMYNTLHLRKSNEKAMDLGIFSFFSTAVSSLFMLRMALGGTLLVCCKQRKDSEENDGLYSIGNNKRKYGGIDHCAPGYCLRIFTFATQLIVVSNYLLGLLFALTAGKQIYIYFASYCSVFSILWLLIAISCWNVLGAYRETIRIMYGDEYINKKSKNRFGCVSLCNRLLAYCYRKLTARQKHNANSDELNEDDDEDEIDEELRALYAGPGKRGYLNISY